MGIFLRCVVLALRIARSGRREYDPSAFSILGVSASGMQRHYNLGSERQGHSPAASQWADHLQPACTAGCGVGAELRFIQKDGELVAKSPEEVLRGDLKFAPIYDLNRQEKISK
ncbi:MAG: hypothetical protein WA228_09125 [Desulfobaccales bacterium]